MKYGGKRSKSMPMIKKKKISGRYTKDKEKKTSKYTTTKNQQRAKEERKRGRKDQRRYKAFRKQLTMKTVSF